MAAGAKMWLQESRYGFESAGLDSGEIFYTIALKGRAQSQLMDQGGSFRDFYTAP